MVGGGAQQLLEHTQSHVVLLDDPGKRCFFLLKCIRKMCRDAQFKQHSLFLWDGSRDEIKSK